MPTLHRIARPAIVSLTLAIAGLAPSMGAAHDAPAHHSQARGRERLEALLRSPPASPEPFRSVGMQLLRAGDFGGAATAFGEAARRDTNPAKAHYNRACALALGGATDEALAGLRVAIDSGFDDPDHMATDEDLESLHGDARFAALLSDAEALEMPPVNPGRWYGGWPGNRGERGSREAVERLGAYLASHPHSGRAAYGLGIAHLNLGAYEDGARSFQRALELGYRRDATLYNLACVDARRGRPEAAFAYLEQAIDAGFHEPGQIRSDDDLLALRGDPRHRAAIRRAEELARADGGGPRGWSFWEWWSDDE